MFLLYSRLVLGYPWIGLLGVVLLVRVWVIDRYLYVVWQREITDP